MSSFRNNHHKSTINPEILRKARRIVEIYDKDTYSNVRTNTILVDLQMFIQNGCFTIDDRTRQFLYRYLKSKEPNVIPGSILCTSISSITKDQGKLVYQTKEKNKFQWMNVSSCFLEKSSFINWNCPFSQQVFDNTYIDSNKIFSDIPTRRKYEKENIVPIHMDKEIIYPVIINNSYRELVNINKNSGYFVAGEEKMFPFISDRNHYEYRWFGLNTVTLHIVYSYYTP